MPKKYILRSDRGTIKSGARCKDEPRYSFYAGDGKKSNTVDLIAHRLDMITIFTDEDIKNGIYVSKGWELIELGQAKKMKGLEDLKTK